MSGYNQQQRATGDFTATSHSRDHSISNNATANSFTSTGNTNLNPVNQTRILLLSSFSPTLKTRDIHALFSEWDTPSSGGFKIKWRDDASCWVVFADAVTGQDSYYHDSGRV